MYSLPYYKENDPAIIKQFIEQHPFAFLAGCNSENNPIATQVPLLFEERKSKIFLHGHMMRQTDHHKAFEKNPNVLCVFTSPHTYVSATWYTDPNQASTWNYISVHAKGKLNFLDGEGLVKVLKKTTLHFENNNSGSSTIFDNLPNDYKERLMKAIIAFEIEVENIENVFKLSQNRDEQSFYNIIEKLEESGSDGRYIASQMKQRAAQLFNEKGTHHGKLEP